MIPVTLFIYLQLIPRSQSTTNTYSTRTHCKNKCNFTPFATCVLHALNQIDKVIFLVDEGIEDQNININGPSSARQRNAI